MIMLYYKCELTLIYKSQIIISLLTQSNHWWSANLKVLNHDRGKVTYSCL